jgi:hypothetical protein
MNEKLKAAWDSMQTLENTISTTAWEESTREERDNMIYPLARQWYAEWRTQLTNEEFEEFKEVWLVKENFHTFSRMLTLIEREEKGILTLAHLAEFSHDEEYVQDLMDVNDCDRDTALMYEAQDFETEVHETCKDLYHDITSRNYANMRIEPEWNCHNPDSELVLGFFPDKGWRGDDKLLDKVISMLSEYVMRPVGHDEKVITDYDEAVKFVKDTLKA